MNRISAHINSEVTNFRLGALQTEFSDNGYRQLQIGDNLDVFMTTEQAEKLFDVLDQRLHKKTYSDLQDDCFSLDCDLATANDEVERLTDEVEEYQAI